MANKNTLNSTVFDETGYDEMQKAANHEIGYKIFSVMFYAVLIIAITLIIWCSGHNDIGGMILAYILLTVVYGCYIVYMYMTAKKGIMNPKFAKRWSHIGLEGFFAMMMVLSSSNLLVSLENKPAENAFWLMCVIISLGGMLICLCAQKNNKVLKEQLKEE